MEKTWKVVLAFVGIFMAGTVTGSLIALRVAKAVMPPQGRPPGAAVEQFGVVQMQRMTRMLELTEAQQDKIRPIVQKNSEEITRLSRETQRETRDIITRMNDQVTDLLTPQQQRKFVEMQRRMNQEMLNRGNRGRGGPVPMGVRGLGPMGPQGQGPQGQGQGGFRPQRPGGRGGPQPEQQPQPQAQPPQPGEIK